MTPMAHTAAASQCFCGTAGENPRTLSELEALGPVTPLEGGLDTLALVGTQLSSALITTNNGAALLMGRGGYAAFQTSAMPYRLSRARVNVRIAPDSANQLWALNRDSIGRRSVVLSNCKNAICHRIETDGNYDNSILDALDAAAAPINVQPAKNPSPDVISLSAVRSARALWDDSDTGRHLNDLISDGGYARHSILPHVGANKAWPVLTQTIVSFITYLTEKQICHARLVPAEGLVQGDLAEKESVKLIGRILLVGEQTRQFALDLDQIASAWITRFGVLSQLELYAADGQAIAVLAADPMSNFGDWNALLASLPAAASPKSQLFQAR